MVDRIPDARGYLVAGLLILGLSFMPLASGLYGYYVILPEIERSQEAVNQAAEEMGLNAIPGVSTDDHLSTLFITIIVIGVSMAVVGGILLSIALLKKRQNGDI